VYAEFAKKSQPKILRMRIELRLRTVYSRSQMVDGILARVHRLLHALARRLQPPAGGTYSTTVSPDVRASLHEDGVVFLDVRGGAVYRSNRIGAAIWKGISGREELGAIALQISRDYGVPLEQAMEDAVAFLRQLETRGFVSRRVIV